MFKKIFIFSGSALLLLYVFLAHTSFLNGYKKSIDLKQELKQIPSTLEKRIDSTYYPACSIVKDNQLYEMGIEIPLHVTIHHATGSFYDKLFLNVDTLNYTIQDTLDKYFYGTGLKPIIKESFIYSDDISINDFDKHAENYDNRKTINVIVYHQHVEDAVVNGIAFKTPGSVCGIILNRAYTVTAVHEIGHLLGLDHVFETDYTDGHSPNFGDKICDTPSFNIMDQHYIKGCQWVGDPKRQAAMDTIITNYLSYTFSYSECRTNFTPLQIKAMYFTIENYPFLQDAVITKDRINSD